MHSYLIKTCKFHLKHYFCLRVFPHAPLPFTLTLVFLIASTTGRVTLLTTDLSPALPIADVLDLLCKTEKNQNKTQIDHCYPPLMLEASRRGHSFWSIDKLRFAQCINSAISINTLLAIMHNQS